MRLQLPKPSARAVVTLLVAVVLAGCSITPKQISLPIPGKAKDAKVERQKVWDTHKERLVTLREWSMKGKMAVKTAQKGGSATVIWDRDFAKHDVEIYGPFGGGRIRLAEDEFGATLTDNKKNVTIGETAYKLLYQEVGWPVPFDALKYWILGLPIPDVWAEWELNPAGYLGWLRQGGWEITFEDYRDREGIPMPRKIKLSALPGTVNLRFPDGQTSEMLDVKFVVQSIKLSAKKAAKAKTPSG